MEGDDCRLIDAYALGALEDDDRARLDSHVLSCAACARSLAQVSEALIEFAGPIEPAPSLRRRILDLAEAPSAPVDLTAYKWEERAPGLKFHTVREDPSRHFRAVLVWAKPGSRYPRHRHLGDEEILVLAGRLRDDRGSYGPGEICRSVTGSEHSEEAEGPDDCICYVVYHGEHELLAE